MKVFKTKTKSPSRIKVLLPGLLAPGLLATSLLAAPVLNVPLLIAPAQAQQNGVAATVGSEKILMADFNRLVNEVKADNPQLAEDTPEAKEALARIRGQILDNLIEQNLLYQEALRRKIKPSGAEVTAVITKVKESYENEAAFTKALKDEGKTVEDLRQMVTKDKAIAELFKQVTADVTITDAEVRAFYDKNKELFTRPEAASVRQIWIAAREDAPASERNKAKARAATLAQQARGDADFGKLAFENSEDPVTKGRGGDMGMVTKESLMADAMRDAIFNTKAGQVAGPIETKSGYHVIKVESRLPSVLVPLDQVVNEVRPVVLQEKIGEKFDQHIATLKAQAKIEKFVQD